MRLKYTPFGGSICLSGAGILMVGIPIRLPSLLPCLTVPLKEYGLPSSFAVIYMLPVAIISRMSVELTTSPSTTTASCIPTPMPASSHSLRRVSGLPVALAP